MKKGTLFKEVEMLSKSSQLQLIDNLDKTLILLEKLADALMKNTQSLEILAERVKRLEKNLDD